VAFSPVAQGIEALQKVHIEEAPYGPIVWTQTLETRHKAHDAMDLLHQTMLLESSRDSCEEGTEEVGEGTETTEVDNTSY
jgi:hypothetical protein